MPQVANMTFHASICPGVTRGICVVLKDDVVLYAGPLGGCPPVAEMMVLLHEDDYHYIEKMMLSFDSTPLTGPLSQTKH